MAATAPGGSGISTGDHPASGDAPTTVNVGRLERWVSAVAGGALAAISLRRGYTRNRLGIFVLAAAGHAIYRGVTGRDRIFRTLGIDTTGGKRQGSRSASQAIIVEKSVTVNRAPEELYSFWRNFENLPRFMDHLQSVRVLDDRRSHWVAKAPAGTSVEWDAEIVDERSNEQISWRSTGRADVDNAGTVQFRFAPGGRGTEVKVRLEYNPPAGLLGVGIAKLFGEEPAQQIEGDLRRFKQLMEEGEIPTTEGQPSGRE